MPGEQPSPRTPCLQSDRWNDPGAFYAAEAVACGSRPPARHSQTALTVGAALILAAGLLVALRSYNR